MVRRVLLIAAIVLLPSSGFCQAAGTGGIVCDRTTWCPGGPSINLFEISGAEIDLPVINRFTYELLLTDKGLRKTFALEPGGCLIGPLEFWDEQDRSIFKLEKGAVFGSGCTKGESR
jgi:hypothetical protein